MGALGEGGGGGAARPRPASQLPHISSFGRWPRRLPSVCGLPGSQPVLGLMGEMGEEEIGARKVEDGGGGRHLLTTALPSGSGRAGSPRSAVFPGPSLSVLWVRCEEIGGAKGGGAPL